MTYFSNSSEISFGRGYFGRSCASSLAMMSLHRATHSSQMKTRGPEISLRTSRRRLPQKEQWKSSMRAPTITFHDKEDHTLQDTKSRRPARQPQTWILAQEQRGSKEEKQSFVAEPPEGV